MGWDYVGWLYYWKYINLWIQMLGKRIKSLKVLDKEMVFQNLSCFLDAKGSSMTVIFSEFWYALILWFFWGISIILKYLSNYFMELCWALELQCLRNSVLKSEWLTDIQKLMQGLVAWVDSNSGGHCTLWQSAYSISVKFRASFWFTWVQNRYFYKSSLMLHISTTYSTQLVLNHCSLPLVQFW